MERAQPIHFMRVVAALPVNCLGSSEDSTKTAFAAKKVIEHFNGELEASTFVDPDYTQFKGYWRQLRFVPELGKESYVEYPAGVSLIILDLPCKATDTERINVAVDKIRNRIFKIYEAEGVVQHEIWIGYHPMTMYVFDEPLRRGVQDLLHVPKLKDGGRVKD